MIPLHFLLRAQKKRSKRKRHHGQKPISALNPQPLPAEKCLSQFEDAECSEETTFLKAGQPTWPQWVHANRTPTVDDPQARISVASKFATKDFLN